MGLEGEARFGILIDGDGIWLGCRSGVVGGGNLDGGADGERKGEELLNLVSAGLEGWMLTG